MLSGVTHRCLNWNWTNWSGKLSSHVCILGLASVGRQLVARTVGLTSVGRQLVARTVGATNMGRQQFRQHLFQKRQVTCVLTKMRQLNRQLHVREVAWVSMSVRPSGRLSHPFDHFINVRSSRNRYGRCILEKVSSGHMFRG